MFLSQDIRNQISERCSIVQVRANLLLLTWQIQTILNYIITNHFSITTALTIILQFISSMLIKNGK